MGADRPPHYLRKFYPWYLAAHGRPARRGRRRLPAIDDLDDARSRVRELRDGRLAVP